RATHQNSVRCHQVTTQYPLLFYSLLRHPPYSTLFPYTTLFRSFLDGVAFHTCPQAISHDAVKIDKTAGAKKKIDLLFTARVTAQDRKSTRLNSSHVSISYAVFCLKKKIKSD